MAINSYVSELEGTNYYQLETHGISMGSRWPWRCREIIPKDLFQVGELVKFRQINSFNDSYYL